MTEVGDPAKLAELHRAFLESGAQVDPGALTAAASDALRIRNATSALTLLDAALVADPEYGPAWALRGAALEVLGREDEAKSAYQSALAQDERDPVTALALGALYAKAGERDRARSLLSWMILEQELPTDLRQRAGQLLRSLS